MSLIDVIHWDGGVNQVAWKFPSTNLRLGSQLIVKQGQTAFFVYRGKICDEVTEGALTLKTANLPFLTQLMSVPFGNESPFQAEVWFINKLSKLDTKWGTRSPIQVEDPKYGIVIPVRAYGQYGFRVSNARLFLESLLGAVSTLTDESIKQYFQGAVISTIGTQIGALLNGNVSILNAAAHLKTLSESAKQHIAPTMKKYGIELEDFFFESINVPEDDSSYIKLKQIKEKAAELHVVGRDIYQLDKSMDVLKTAADNQGMAGLMMQPAMGAGMGMMMGASLGQQAGNMLTKLPAPGNQELAYYVSFSGKQTGPFSLAVLQQMYVNTILRADTLVWCQGMPGWEIASKIPELQPVSQSITQTPITPPLPNIN